MDVFDTANNYLDAVERTKSSWQLDHNQASLALGLGAAALAPVLTSLAERAFWGIRLDHYDTDKIIDSQLRSELLSRVDTAQALTGRFLGHDLIGELDR